MWYEWLLLICPALIFALKALTDRHGVAYVLVGVYPSLLLCLSALSGSVFSIPRVELPLEVINLLRVGVHCLIFFVLAIAASMRRVPLRPLPTFTWVVLALLAMATSVVATQGDFITVARLGINLLMMLNIFVLAASLIRFRENWEVPAQGAAYLALSLMFISAYVILRHGFSPEWSLRLGRPWNPGVLSLVLATGLLASHLGRVPTTVRILLAIGVFVSASRLDVMIALPFAAYLMIRHKKLRTKSLVGILVCVLLLAAVNVFYIAELPETVRPFSRSSFLSGREDLWVRGIEMLRQSPWLGSGKPQYLDRRSTIYDWELQRVHNMFLELSISYGILAGCLSMMVLLSLASGILALRRLPSVKEHFITGLGLVSLIAGHMIFGTSSWTNLGDGSIILLLGIIMSMHHNNSATATRWEGWDIRRRNLKALDAQNQPRSHEGRRDRLPQDRRRRANIKCALP